jgi:hypothetical protein
MKKSPLSDFTPFELKMPPLVEVPEGNLRVLLLILDQLYQEKKAGPFLGHAFPITDHLPDQIRVLGFQGAMLVYPIAKWLKFYYEDYPGVISFAEMTQLNTLLDNPLAILGNELNPHLIQVIVGLKSANGQVKPILIEINRLTNECEIILEE